MRTVGIGVLVDDTGEKPRALQHWTDLGILRAEPGTDKQGRGFHREFIAEPNFGERKWALMASALNVLRVPLGGIRRIIDESRTLGEPITKAGKDGARERFHSALRGRGDVLFFVGVSHRGGTTLIDYKILPAITEDIKTPSAAKILGQIADMMSEHQASYCLNLTKIFEPLRSA